MKNRQPLFALYAIPLSIVMALIIGPILRGGMFMDGLLYTNLAKNMASGLGDFWHPVLDQGAVFYEHPPLLFWLESLFFKVFGNHLFVEDLYNLTILITTIGLMYGIWQEIVPKQQRQLFFLPLLFWVLSQEVQLRYPNAMLECGMTMFLLATAFAFFRIVKSRPLLAATVVGIGAFIAVLCKGPAGLFIMALPTLHNLILEKRLNFGSLLLPPVVLAICFTFLFSLNPDALAFFQRYLDQQVLAAIQGERIENIANSRFDFLKALVLLNIPTLAIATIMISWRPRRWSQHAKAGLLLIALGMSAVLPLVITIKQATYYQLPALPFLFLGLALPLTDKAEQLIAYMEVSKARRLTLITIGLIGILATSVFAFSMVGTIDRRDRANISRAAAISRIMNDLEVTTYNFSIIGIDNGFDQPLYYPISGHLNRRYDIHYDSSGNSPVTLTILRNQEALFPDDEVLFLDDEVILIR